MKKLLTALLLCGGIGSLAPQLVAQTSTISGNTTREAIENALKQHAISIPLLKDDKKPLLYVRGKIDGVDSFMFVDSGAESIVVSKKTAEKSGMELKQSEPANGGSKNTHTNYSSTIKALQVGPAVLKNVDVPVEDLSHLRPVNVKGKLYSKNAVLGLRFFHGTKAVLDYQNSRIIIAKRPIRGGIATIYKQAKLNNVKLVKESGRLYIPIRLNSHDVLFLCDSGVAHSTLNPSAVRKLGAVKLDEKAKLITPSGTKKVSVATLPNLDFGGIKLENVRVHMIEGKPQRVSARPIVGVIGGDLLTATEAIIDFNKSQLFFGVGL